MLIEDFINNTPNWERVLSSDPYCITVKKDGEYFLLKYSQIDSDFSNEIVQQARGSIFKMVNDKAVCVCRPFRKFHNIQESNAAEIDWDTAYVQEKVDGCFTKWDKVLLADGSSRAIGEIVSKKQKIEVMSYNHITKKIEPKKIIGWKKSTTPQNIKDWLTIELEGVKTSMAGKISQHCTITPTPNHIFFRKGNEGQIEEVEAAKLKENDIIYTFSEGLTHNEEQVILGTLLGDGSCTNYQNPYAQKGVCFTHSLKQKDYVDFKASLLQRIGGKSSQKYSQNSFSPEKYYYQSNSNSSISSCYDIIYDKKTLKKRITKEWLNRLDWLGIAIWYMDDGSLDKACLNNAIFLHTEGFSLEEQNIIMSFFEEKYGFKMTLRDDGRGHNFLRFDTNSSEIIFKNIRNFICPSMQYKLPIRHLGYFDKDFIADTNICFQGLKEGKIKSIKKGLHAHNYYNSQSVYKYDIEVEDNHNYFCQGVLVHNSLMKMWYDLGEWHLSTNNTIDAFKAIVVDGPLTFGDIFLRAVGHKTLESFAAPYDKSRTYCFELTSPETQVVIPYDDGVYFLTSFETATGIEEYAYYPASSVKCPKLYDFKSKEDILAVAEKMSHDEEGFVVCDAQGNRVKVKSKGWLMAHYTLKNNVVTYKYLFKLAQDDLLDDFLAVGARYVDKVQEVKDFLSLIKEECEIGWSLVSHLANEPQKHFAQEALKTRQPHYCFSKRKNKDLTPEQYIKSLTVKYLTATFHNRVPS